MSQYSQKMELYLFVKRLKKHLGVSNNAPPFNAILDVQKSENIDLQYKFFTTDGFCGMAFKGDKIDSIILNSARKPLEQNFDCAHEMVHLTLHRNCEFPYFQCFKSVKPMQNSFLEWQANEGAAEYLMPHDKILAYIKNYHCDLHNWHDIALLKSCLARDFSVTDTMIRIRLETLRYEIDQHLSGVDIGEIEILSDRQQKKYGLAIKSLNDIEFEGINNEFVAKFACRKNAKKEIMQISTSSPDYIKWEENWLFPNG